MARSLAGYRSPGVETVAALTTDGDAANPTETVSVKTLESPPAIGPGLLAVTMAPETDTVQPAPALETKPSPAGSVSRTVMTPAVGPALTLTTDSV